jgi:hypothetical protein
MKHKSEIALRALIAGIEIQLPSLRYRLMWGDLAEKGRGELWYTGFKNLSTDEECCVPALDITLEYFVNECEKLSDEYVWTELVFKLGVMKEKEG